MYDKFKSPLAWRKVRDSREERVSLQEEVESEHYHSDSGDEAAGSSVASELYLPDPEQHSLTDAELDGIITAVQVGVRSPDTENVRTASDLLSIVTNETTRTNIIANMIETFWTDDTSASFFRLLISSSVSLSGRDKNGCNAAHRACIRGGTGTAAMVFLEEMSKQQPQIINQKAGSTLRGTTCLHVAAIKAQHRLLDWLLSCKDLDAEQKDGDQRTALQIACEKDNALSVSVLAARHVATVLNNSCYRHREPYMLYDYVLRRCRGTLEPEVPTVGYTLFLVSANHLGWILALLKLLNESEAWEPNVFSTYLRFIERCFREQSLLPTRLLLREFTMSFETVKPRRSVRHQSDRSVQHDLSSIVMPYFYSERWSSIQKRRNIGSPTTASTSRPNQHTRYDKHLPLTLDEYCNPALGQAILDRRNEDQVVVRSATRQQRDRGSRKRDGTWNMEPKTRLLMVHQVWVYRTDSIFILAFPDVVLQEATVKGCLEEADDSGLLHLFSDPSLSIALVPAWLSSFVGLLELPIGLSRPVLDIFEESIFTVSNDVDEYFKKSSKEQEKSAYAEKQFLHDIADIREELSMIRHVITQQENVFAELKARLLQFLEDGTKRDADEPGSSQDPTLESDPGNRTRLDARSRPAQEAQGRSTSRIWVARGRSTLIFPPPGRAESRKSAVIYAQTHFEKAALRLGKLKERIDRADQNAQRVQELIPQYLELKRSYATMKESHYTALLGAAVFGLSVVTIIFTPLSFVLALLAVPDDSLLVGPVQDARKKSYVGKWAGITECVSIGATLVATLFAWWLFKYKSELRAASNGVRPTDSDDASVRLVRGPSSGGDEQAYLIRVAREISTSTNPEVEIPRVPGAAERVGGRVGGSGSEQRNAKASQAISLRGLLKRPERPTDTEQGRD